jgi:uncharacterized protein
MLTVDITEYTSGAHHLSLDPTAEKASLDADRFRDVHVEADLQCHRDRILVQLHASAVATLTCDRTLQSFEQTLEGDYSVLFGPPSMAGDGEEGALYDEVRPLRRSDREIDLTDIVRDTLHLAVPQRCIAPGAEDESIQTTYGAPDAEETSDDGPVDPRWSKLKQLRDDDA